MGLTYVEITYRTNIFLPLSSYTLTVPVVSATFRRRAPIWEGAKRIAPESVIEGGLRCALLSLDLGSPQVSHLWAGKVSEIMKFSIAAKTTPVLEKVCALLIE